MKYALVVGAFYSTVFARNECKEGTTIYTFSDDECTELIEDATKELTAEEAAQIDCTKDTTGKNSFKISCDGIGYHQNTWIGSETCTGDQIFSNFHWNECTKFDDKWIKVKKPGMANPGSEEEAREQIPKDNYAFWAVFIGIFAGLFSAHMSH